MIIKITTYTKALSLFLTFCFLISFQKSTYGTSETGNSILGMILLEDKQSMRIDAAIKELKMRWKLKATNTGVVEEGLILNIEDNAFLIAHIPAPIPGDEISTTAAYQFFWEDAETEATKHQSHIIISMPDTGNDLVKANLLFTKVVSSFLNHSNAIGFYMGSRSLLLEKEFYVEAVEELSKDELPLFLWLYFGFRKEEKTHSMYTYGLEDFGKRELEIIESDQPIDVINEMMYNISHYIIAYDVTLKDGETIGESDEQKLKISLSKGKYLDQKTLKINF